MKNKLVSIACRVYNAEDTIAKSIESVLAQTYSNWELIICDDNSTDSTQKIIKNYNDPRIKYYRNSKNIGIVGNLNKAISLCTGEYISILDGDDFYFPKKLELQVRFLDENPDYGAVFSYVNIKNLKAKKILNPLINNPSETRALMLKKIFFTENFLAFPTEIFRREFIIEFPESIIATGDCNFHISILFKSKIKVLEIPLVDYSHNGESNTSTWITNELIDSENIYMLKHFAKIPSVELFKEVFVGEYEKYGEPTENKDLPYFIARIAMGVPHRNFSGLYLLQCLFEDNDYFRYIMDKFDISYKDYMDMRKSVGKGLNNSVKKKILGICYYRAKRYENKIVKTFLYVFKKVIYSQTIDFYFANIKLFTICNKADNVK